MYVTLEFDVAVVHDCVSHALYPSFLRWDGSCVHMFGVFGDVVLVHCLPPISPVCVSGALGLGNLVPCSPLSYRLGK